MAKNVLRIIFYNHNEIIYSSKYDFSHLKKFVWILRDILICKSVSESNRKIHKVQSNFISYDL